MAGLFQTAVRLREAEVMDDPHLDEQQHFQALRGLMRINSLSGSCATVWRPMAALARQLNGQPLRVLDIASGGGDVAIGLWQRAQRCGLDICVEGCDCSERAVAFATRLAEGRRANVRFFVKDVLRDGVPDGYEVLISSLFLHHLDEDDGVALLAAMGRAAGHMVLINDLRRSAMGYAMACGVPQLLTRSPVVHVDARRSVRAAFTMAEARQLARRAELDPVQVQPCWPQRWLLSWRRP